MNDMPKKTSGEYTAKAITVLEGLEAVRRRPGMYIGSTGAPGLHHLIWECVDNSIDEAMAGYCNEITVRLLPDAVVEVRDNGRGIPVDVHPQYKVSALELVMTKLHAGGKFGGEGYKVSGGLHGVGVSVVNALSDWCKAEVRRDGRVWVQEYKRGKPQGKVKPEGKATGAGTTITFKPDSSIIETLEYDWTTILDHLRQQAYLTKGVHITISDERQTDAQPNTYNLKPATYSFYFEGGVASYVRHLNRAKEPKHENIFYADKPAEGVQVEVALQYVDDFKESVYAFANNIFNPDGGTHVVGFRAALTRTLNAYARAKGYLKEKDENLGGEDVREGLTTVISVKIKDPQFEGQTKAKLGNPEVKTAVEAVFGDAFATWLEEHPRDGEAVVGKCVLAQKARTAARLARETVLRKGALEGFTLPGKLADCSSRERERTELFLVEGDSAGGCFSGDTKVALADGRALSFIELVKEARAGKQNYCYTIMPDGSVGIEKILSPRLTKAAAEVIEITLDNHEAISCTPDHLFLLRDGRYKKAEELTDDDSLTPLYREISKIGGRVTIEGYEQVFDLPRNRWKFTHLLADEYNLRNGVYAKEDGAHRHHLDFNKRNNNPNNIRRVSKEGHMAIHREQVDKTLRRPDVIEKNRIVRQTPAYRAKISATMKTMAPALRERAKKQWEDPAYKKFMIEKFSEFYETNAAYRETNNKLLDAAQRAYWSDAEHRNKQSERTRQFFKVHPDRKVILRKQASTQWNDAELRAWRAEETKKQWTAEFRAKRKAAYNRTYYAHSLKLAADVYRTHSALDAYDAVRSAAPHNKNYLKLNTLINRFFNGDRHQLESAAQKYNHRVVRIRRSAKRIPVYDIEVPGTHNFALASGVFVHNSAKQGRNREFQAILPLRGKILNVERARLDKILTNNELKSLIIAMGTNVGEQFDIAALRYARIIIMTDADVDGAHIRTLLLTLFYRYFPEVILRGHLYIAQPPLYRVQVGKEARYAYSDAEKAQILAELGSRGQALTGRGQSRKQPPLPAGEGEGEGATSEGAKVNIQRYKGLGEMNPSQLWETTMDPTQRTMKVVTVEDAEKADELFDILMGNEVEPRKRFIHTHAKAVKNLDI